MVGGGGLKRENEVAGSSPWGCGDCVRALFVGIRNRRQFQVPSAGLKKKGKKTG